VAREFRFTNRLHRPVITTLPVNFSLRRPFHPVYTIKPAPGCVGFLCPLSERLSPQAPGL
jgi:hypothetical protein